jgi:hypothetical protein
VAGAETAICPTKDEVDGSVKHLLAQGPTEAHRECCSPKAVPMHLSEFLVLS